MNGSAGNVIKRLIRVLCMCGGLALACYGIVLLFSLDHLFIGKFSYEGRDTSSAVLVMLLGGALFLYGLWSDGGE